METCKRVLMFEEGFRAFPYLCPAGKSTIGYGHNLDANPLTENDREAMGLVPGDAAVNRTQAEVLLVRDMGRLIVPAAHKIFGAANWEAFGEVRRAALGSMIYQLGEGGFSAFKNLRSAVLRYDWAGAATAALDSAWAQQTPARARRHATALLTNRDVWRLIR